MTKATVPEEVLFFSFWEVKQATLKSNKTDVQNIETTTRVQPERPRQAVTTSPAFVSSLSRAHGSNQVWPFAVHFAGGSSSFHSLFSSFCSLFQSLIFSKAFLEDSHYVTLKIHVNSRCHLWREKNSSIFIWRWLLHLITPKTMENSQDTLLYMQIKMYRYCCL